MFSLLIILAFGLRLLLMPISVHSDLFFINAYPALLVKKNIYDIFSFFAANFPNTAYTYYPPLTYFTFGLFQYLYGLFSSTFSNWMLDLYYLETSNFQGQAVDLIKASPNPNLYKDLFLAKTPYLIFDLLVVFTFFIMIKNKAKSKALTLLWLFNPVHLYSTYLMGQYEVLPAYFVLLGLLMMRKKVLLGFLILGISAAYKNYAFAFIIVAILIYARNWKQRLAYLATSLIPYLIAISPTLFTNPAGAIYSFVPKVYLSYRKPLYGWGLYSQYIKYVLLAISLISTVSVIHFIKLKNKWNVTIGISLIVILLVYALAPRISFHYLIWELPLLLFWAKSTRQYLWIIAVQSISLASYKLLANHLQLGLFSPLNYNFAQIPTFNSQINHIFPYTIISNTGFFVFLFVNLYLASKIMVDLVFREQTN